ncbi:unnamed protein product [Rotaria sp. Silwood1]|nr:unnamed protein product [Rotaria sp. Silwood1]
MMNQWENDELTSNVINSSCTYHEFSPKTLINRIDNLEKHMKLQALCYLLSNNNTLTKFHCDNGGGGWIYLEQEKRL